MKEKNNEGKILFPKEISVVSPENIKDLRSKSLTPKSDTDFKKNLFGGYDAKEVNDYIRNVNNQHNRTITAYQERIDEFTTFIEMLNKEKEDIVKNYENNYSDVTVLKERCENYESEINTYKEEKERLNSEISNIVSEYSEKMKVLESEFGISKENELLKDEVNALSISRDGIQSRNSILNAELETARDDLEKTKSENKKLRDEIALLNSRLRKFRMNQSMKIIEFSEREIFTLKKTEEKLNNLIEDIGKLTENAINFKQSNAEEIVD